ncbi:MAG: low molecular weight protein-tyrosine-phosphatase [Planctomycetota bacterium]|nr:low molecular weight protein-tyrosine-phosphatase [Planctomycetota bacterium]
MSVGPTRVLFVCLGNICRSPMAKWVFADMVRARGLAGAFHIDSCGLGGWHEGEDADPRSRAVAERLRLACEHRARQIRVPQDFEAFDLLVAMDRENLRGLARIDAPRERVRLLRSFDPAMAGLPEVHLDVPDPYYGGDEGFDRMHQMIVAACAGMLERLAPPTGPTRATAG